MTLRDEYLEDMEEVMWDYSASETDDEMVSRCNYCGRFSHKSILDAKTSLCMKCKKELHPIEAAEDERKQKEEEVEKQKKKTTTMTKKKKGDQSDAGFVASKAPGADELKKDSTVTANPGASADGFVDADDAVKETMGDPEADDEEKEEEDTSAETCARCWATKATGILYNSPICDECRVIAEAKRQGKGTNKRYQPPTPFLEPGKRLTRVCEPCRQKRKRCQHRRVVDADDPEAHRRKRTKKEEVVEQKEKDTETFKVPKRRKEAIEVLPTIEEGSESSEVEADATQEPKDAADSCHVNMVDEEEVYDSDDCSNVNLQRAINDSMNLVYKRELLRLEAAAQAKIEEANKATAAVKHHLKVWNKYLTEQKKAAA